MCLFLNRGGKMNTIIKNKVLAKNDIKGIINSFDKTETIQRNQELLSKIVSGNNNLSDDEIFEFIESVTAFAIKKEISEEDFDNIKITITNEDRGNSYGTTVLENDRVTNILFSNYHCFCSKDIFKILAGLGTFGHELCHFSQRKRLRNDEKSIRSFIMALEFAIATTSPELYNTLYGSLLSEVEAEVKGAETISDFFTSISPDFDSDKLKEIYLLNSCVSYDYYNNRGFVYNYIVKLIDLAEKLGILNSKRNNKISFPEFEFLNQFFDEDGAFNFELDDDYDEFELLVDDSFEELSFEKIMIPDDTMLNRVLARIMVERSFTSYFDDTEEDDKKILGLK